jgi:hypothetical protein
MAVDPRTRQGDEEITGPHQPRIHLGAGEQHLAGPAALGAHDGGGLGRGQLHGATFAAISRMTS